MGNWGSTDAGLSHEETKEYMEETFFTYSEIKSVYKRFSDLDPLQNNCLTVAEFTFIEELVHNSFKRRIFEVFAEGQDNMTCDQFINFASVFHQRTPMKVKVSYAFKLFDVDGDGTIGAEDIRDVLDLMVDNEDKLSNDDKDKVVDYVLDEIQDQNFTEGLSKVDFLRMAKRVPSFAKRFSITII